MLNRKSALLAASAILASTPSMAALTLLDKGPVTFTTGGFVELDAIWDTTQSFNEITGSNPVKRPDTVAGQNGRNMLSIRNSRIYFQADSTTASGMNLRGLMEFDLFGFDPAPSTNGLQSEYSFFSSPTLRVRHAYFRGEEDGWSVLAGQTWELFGWQPYYFPTTATIQNVPAEVFTRTAQLRLMKTGEVANSVGLTGAFAVLRSPQRDSDVPDFQAGIRVTYDKWKAASTNSSSAALTAQPASFGVSGLFREIRVPSTNAGQLTNYAASAISLNGFLPVLPADENDLTHSLSLFAGFTAGKGYGDQFGGWTGGTASPTLASATAATFPASAAVGALDAGLGDYNNTGSFELIQLSTFNAGLQYVLPLTDPTWVDLGYFRMHSNNMYRLVNAAGLASGGGVPYVTNEFAYINVFRDLTKMVRVGLEYSHVRTTYADAITGNDNRIQFSSFFIF